MGLYTWAHIYTNTRHHQLLGKSIIGYVLISTYRVLLLQALDNLNLVIVYTLVLQAS